MSSWWYKHQKQIVPNDFKAQYCVWSFFGAYNLTMKRTENDFKVFQLIILLSSMSNATFGLLCV